jgi:hypothetical protein
MLPEYKSIKYSAVAWRNKIYEYLLKIGDEVDLCTIPSVVLRPDKLLRRIKIKDVLITDTHKRFIVIYPKPPVTNVRVRLSSYKNTKNESSNLLEQDDPVDLCSFNELLEKWKLAMIAFLEENSYVTTNILGFSSAL